MSMNIIIPYSAPLTFPSTLSFSLRLSIFVISLVVREKGISDRNLLSSHPPLTTSGSRWVFDARKWESVARNNRRRIPANLPRLVPPLPLHRRYIPEARTRKFFRKPPLVLRPLVPAPVALRTQFVSYFGCEFIGDAMSSPLEWSETCNLRRMMAVDSTAVYHVAFSRPKARNRSARLRRGSTTKPPSKKY